MANLSGNDDFAARALASFNNQMNLANTQNESTTAAIEIESYAKSLVEDDLPKIDSAVKSYLSLVAARSSVASDIDVISVSSPVVSSTVQCTFASTAKTPMDANRCALVCARTLLATMNSTSIPPLPHSEHLASIAENEDQTIDNGDNKQIELEKDASTILWNKLVQSSSNTGDKKKQNKPSKVLGRDSLQIAFPFIAERFRRGIMLIDNADTDTSDDAKAIESSQKNPLHSLSNELLPPVVPPNWIDIGQWKAFYEEFGNLLTNACQSHNEEKEPPQSTSKMDNDSALVWSCDKGVAELKQRREMRAQRASEALASVEDAKAAVTDAVLGSAATGDGGN